MRYVIVAIGVVGALGSASTRAEVQEFTNRAAWQAMVGDFTTIHFTELPANTWVTDQYASLGALFTDGSDQIFLNNGFLNDGFGLNGALDEITVEFTQPMNYIACDYPGGLQFTLFDHGQPIYVSDPFLGSVGSFAGLVSDMPFDSVLIVDGGVFIDDLYFGSPVPGPGALGLFAVLVLPGRSRRRN